MKSSERCDSRKRGSGVASSLNRGTSGEGYSYFVGLVPMTKAA